MTGYNSVMIVLSVIMTIKSITLVFRVMTNYLRMTYVNKNILFVFMICGTSFQIVAYFVYL